MTAPVWCPIGSDWSRARSALPLFSKGQVVAAYVFSWVRVFGDRPLSCADLARGSGVALRTVKYALAALQDAAVLGQVRNYGGGRRLASGWRLLAAAGPARVKAALKRARDLSRMAAWRAASAARRAVAVDGATVAQERNQALEVRAGQGVKPLSAASHEAIIRANQGLAACPVGSEWWEACAAVLVASGEAPSRDDLAGLFA